MNKANQESSLESSTVAAFALPFVVPLGVPSLSGWMADPFTVGPDTDGFSASEDEVVEVSGSDGWIVVGGEELAGMPFLEDPNNCAATQLGNGGSASSIFEVWPLALVDGTAANCSVPFTVGIVLVDVEGGTSDAAFAGTADVGGDWVVAAAESSTRAPALAVG
jgi:hypothetical protein